MRIFNNFFHFFIKGTKKVRKYKIMLRREAKNGENGESAEPALDFPGGMWLDKESMQSPDRDRI